MRGAFGKPQGQVARVNIGQIIVSVRGRDQHKQHIIEALRRAKFKFPGRQKVGRAANTTLATNHLFASLIPSCLYNPRLGVMHAYWEWFYVWFLSYSSILSDLGANSQSILDSKRTEQFC